MEHRRRDPEPDYYNDPVLPIYTLAFTWGGVIGFWLGVLW